MALISSTDLASLNQPVVSASITSNVTISANYPTFANITGLTVTVVTTRANQPVLMCACLPIAGGVNTSAVAGYTIDGGSNVQRSSETTVTNGLGNLSFCELVTISTAGSHTIQLTGSRGTANFDVQGSTSGVGNAFLTAIPL